MPSRKHGQIFCHGCGARIFKPLLKQAIKGKVADEQNVYYCDMKCLISPPKKS